MSNKIRRRGKKDKSLVEVCDDNSSFSEGSWSSLPLLVLWMIKDKLDFVDNVRMSAVCRDWRSASACYPEKLQSARDRLPWIQGKCDNDASALQFISVSRGEKFRITTPGEALCTLFSKQGWLLFLRTKVSCSGVRLPESVFLYNPFTKTEIDMPDLKDISSYNQYAGSFSTVDGYPNRVVIAAVVAGSGLVVRVVCPGSEEWIEHPGIAQGFKFDGFPNSAVIGDLLYFFDTFGGMIIYNMKTRDWKSLPRSRRPSSIHIMESQGEIIKVDHSWYVFSNFKFTRYSYTNNAWENLSRDDMKDKSWFLSDFYTCFSVEEEGSKVYLFSSKRDRRQGSAYIEGLVYNFEDGSSFPFFPNQLSSSSIWVDMG